jgi:hypothetical protein
MKDSIYELSAVLIELLMVVAGIALCGFVGFLLGRSSGSKAYQANLALINHIRAERDARLETDHEG